MDTRYLLALDQGTTSSRAIIFSKEGRLVAQAAFEFAQHYPKPGWVEHEPEDILSSTVRAMKEALSKASLHFSDIAAIGITNQRETTLIWDKKSGKPVYRAIVWQCRRTAGIIEQVKAEGLQTTICEKTGLVPDAYFSASKITWILDETGLRDKAEKGELCFGTVDSFLAWHLVKGHPHVTDATNASRTMLFNLKTQDWDEDLLRIFKVPRAILPEIIDTAQVVGDLSEEYAQGAKVPVSALAGDQHAALFGQGCLSPGEVKNTYGTGCFMLMNTGDKIIRNEKGLLATMAWRLSGQPVYALEGSVFVAGAAVQWLRDELGILQSAAQSEQIAGRVTDTKGVYFVPAFTGLGAPHWDMYARGTLLGLSRGTGAAHITRAVLEAIAFQSNDLLGLMADSLGQLPKTLKVDGGATQNNLLMQMQADISDVAVLRPKVRETTALGAALLAGLGAGLFKNPTEAAGQWQLEARFESSLDESKRRETLKGWKNAVSSTLFDAAHRKPSAE